MQAICQTESDMPVDIQIQLWLWLGSRVYLTNQSLVRSLRQDSPDSVRNRQNLMNVMSKQMDFIY